MPPPRRPAPLAICPASLRRGETSALNGRRGRCFPAPAPFIGPDTALSSKVSPRMSKSLPSRPLRPATLLVRGGTMRTDQDETSEALFLTSGFVYDSAEQAEATFNGTATHYQYSRFGNPTVTMLEQRLAAL